MEHQRIDKCEVCRATDVVGVVVCSTFGAHSFACCEACLEVDKEPYRAIVDYISAAGHWPEDINPIYQREVRRQLKLHDISEEVFKFDVDRAILEEQAFIKEMCAGKVNFKETLKYEEF